MARKIDTADARRKLPAKPKPYWVRLVQGCSLGYRKLAAGAEGTWVARVYDPATRKDKWHSLGSFDHLQPGERYGAAKKAAEGHHAHLNAGGAADSADVAGACRRYVDHLRAEGKPSTADDAQARFARRVDSSKLAKLDVRKLQPHHLRAWRQALASEAVTVNPHADINDRRTRARSPASVNRDMSSLRAALNLALRDRLATTDAAWRDELKPIAGAGKRRALYLDRGQRAALVKAAQPDLAAFLKALSLVPLRPGALAALTVANLDRKLGMLTIDADKAGQGRSIPLPAATLAFFTGLAKDKLPAAPLLARADGKAWDKDAWKKPVRAAAAAAELPADTTAYTLRHSVITDLVSGGLDVLTVARLSGTSIQMIDRHYGHLRAAHAAAALATLAL